MTKNMRKQGGFVGDDGGSIVVKMGGSSTMATYLPEKEENRWAFLQ